ncbi:MAG: cupin domain-containing protein [Pirellulales bacterium]|nr:cupin domain-containing protein [Pirellulales bacterium]
MNLYDLPQAVPEEVVMTLHEAAGLRIERIVSRGQASAEGFWYDQQEHEWVLVVQGGGRVEFENGEVRKLATGDHLFIPARTRHRVQWTDPAETTIWLAVHYGGVGEDSQAESMTLRG